MQNHQLRKIADDLKAVVGSERGFALFLFDEGAYCSNADRADIVTMIREWLAKAHLLRRVTSTTRARSPLEERFETQDEVRERLKLEALCAKTGRRLFDRHGKLALFLFTFGEAGNLAWKTNDETIRAQLQRWCESVSPS